MRTEEDGGSWLDFFPEGVEQTATNAVATAQHLLRLFRQDEQAIQRSQRTASTALRVFRVLCERPLVTVNQVCRRTQLSFPAAARALETLGSLNIVREITGQRRNRVFVYQKYLEILSEGKEI